MKFIEVTQEDIKLSRKLIEKTNIRSTNYPICLALKRSFPEKQIAIVSGLDDVRQVLIDGVLYDIWCDPVKYCDVSVFLNRFDLGREVYPFVCEINLDD